MTPARTVVELFTGHPERWTKGALSRTPTGKSVGVSRALEVRFDTASWCLYGALCKVYEINPPAPFYVLVERCYKAMEELFPELFANGMPKSVNVFNDHPTTTFEDVLAVAIRAKV
jgi:hypothetical protein